MARTLEEKRAYQKAYREANKDKRLAYARANADKLNANSKKYYAENAEILKAKTRDYRKLNGDKRNYTIAERKLACVKLMGGKCFDCGKEYPHYVYDFHHLNPEEKEGLVNMQWSWEHIVNELNKCVMLCSNCHRIRHHGDKHGY